jgi:hypothetical protein
MRQFIDIIERFLIRIVRRCEYAPVPERRRTSAAFGLLLPILGGSLVLIAAPFFWLEGIRAQFNPLLYKIPPADWRVNYEGERNCSEPGCNWEVRVPDQHRERLTQTPSESYWISTTMSNDLLRRAWEDGARVLVAGYIYGRYEMYVNGRQVLIDDFRKTWSPAKIDLAFPPEDEDLFLSLKVYKDSGVPVPDALEVSGLASREQLARQLRWEAFNYQTGPALVFGFYLSLGIFLLVLWISGIRRQEIAAMAGFALLQSGMQALNMPLVWAVLSADTGVKLKFVVENYQWIAVLMLAAAMARVRTYPVLIGGFALLAVPWSIFLFHVNASDLSIFVSDCRVYLNTGAELLAALLTFAQARRVARELRPQLLDNGRIFTLNSASMFFLMLAMLEANSALNDFNVMVFYFGFVTIGMTTILLMDYRQQEARARLAPMSKYHRLARPPDSVHGVVGFADIKKSELLYALGAQMGRGGSLVQDIVSQFYRLVTDAGGEVIQTEGDSILFMLEFPKDKVSFAAVHKLFAVMNERLRARVADLTSKEGLLAGDEVGLRAAAEIGDLKPIWEYVDGRNYPGWSQIGEDNGLTEVARVMEAANKLHVAGSILALRSSYAAKLQSERPHLQWAAWEREIALKHSTALKLSAVLLV